MSSVPSAGTGHYQFILLAKLTASPLNHRKNFDKVKMDELTDSVRSKGILQPILARPLGEAFEVVAGERRFRAAKAAKLTDIPAIVREMNDTEALEIQVIENAQRVDPHPLEEAEGYGALLDCIGADGHKYTVDQIAAKVGMSKSHIYGRMKLLALCPKARKAFYAGDVDASVALLIARIPGQGLQEQALEKITEGEYGGGPMSYRDAAEFVQETFMLRLKDAPFDVKEPHYFLQPGNRSAPPCAQCPKRTGAQPELFQDVKSADVCTDPACFAGKRGAEFERSKLKAVESGKEVVKSAKGLVKLDDRCNDDPKWRTYREILGKEAPKPVLLIDAKGEAPRLVEAVRKEEIEATLKKKGAVRREASRASNVDREEENALKLALFKAVIPKLPKVIGKTEIISLIDQMSADLVDVDAVAEVLCPKLVGITKFEEIEKGLKALDLPTLTRFFFALREAGEALASWRNSSPAAKLAKEYGVDVAKVKASVKAEIKAKAKDTAKDTETA